MWIWSLVYNVLDMWKIWPAHDTRWQVCTKSSDRLSDIAITVAVKVYEFVLEPRADKGVFNLGTVLIAVNYNRSLPDLQLLVTTLDSEVNWLLE